jgi:hypothetical protein
VTVTVDRRLGLLNEGGKNKMQYMFIKKQKRADKAKFLAVADRHSARKDQ